MMKKLIWGLPLMLALMASSCGNKREPDKENPNYRHARKVAEYENKERKNAGKPKPRIYKQVTPPLSQQYTTPIIEAEEAPKQKFTVDTQPSSLEGVICKVEHMPISFLVRQTTSIAIPVPNKWVGNEWEGAISTIHTNCNFTYFVGQTRTITHISGNDKEGRPFEFLYPLYEDFPSGEAVIKYIPTIDNKITTGEFVRDFINPNYTVVDNPPINIGGIVLPNGVTHKK